MGSEKQRLCTRASLLLLQSYSFPFSLICSAWSSAAPRIQLPTPRHCACLSGNVTVCLSTLAWISTQGQLAICWSEWSAGCSNWSVKPTDSYMQTHRQARLTAIVQHAPPIPIPYSPTHSAPSTSHHHHHRHHHHHHHSATGAGHSPHVAQLAKRHEHRMEQEMRALGFDTKNLPLWPNCVDREMIQQFKLVAKTRRGMWRPVHYWRNILTGCCCVCVAAPWESMWRRTYNAVIKLNS